MVDRDSLVAVVGQKLLERVCMAVDINALPVVFRVRRSRRGHERRADRGRRRRRRWRGRGRWRGENRVLDDASYKMHALADVCLVPELAGAGGFRSWVRIDVREGGWDGSKARRLAGSNESIISKSRMQTV